MCGFRNGFMEWPVAATNRTPFLTQSKLSRGQNVKVAGGPLFLDKGQIVVLREKPRTCGWQIVPQSATDMDGHSAQLKLALRGRGMEAASKIGDVHVLHKSLHSGDPPAFYGLRGIG